MLVFSVVLPFEVLLPFAINAILYQMLHAKQLSILLEIPAYLKFLEQLKVLFMGLKDVEDAVLGVLEVVGCVEAEAEVFPNLLHNLLFHRFFFVSPREDLH